MADPTPPAPVPPAAPAVSPTGKPVITPGKWQPIAAAVVSTLGAVPLVADQIGYPLPPIVRLISGVALLVGMALGIVSSGMRKQPVPVVTAEDALKEAQRGPQP